MILKQAIQQARAILKSNKVENPELTAEVILRNVLNLSRVELYQSLPQELSEEKGKIFRQHIQRHLDGEPVAYIIGHKEFYGLDLYVDDRVLIPRPETELLVEKALEIARNKQGIIVADIGTGCGAVAVSLALNLREVKIYATDVSAPALEVAVENSQRHHVLDKIVFLEGNLLEPLPEPVDVIIGNLPYVKKADIDLFRPLGFEPRLALDGGEDGLCQIRQFCSQVKGKVKPGGSILLEVGEGQSKAVASLLCDFFPNAMINIFKDFAAIERVVQMTTKRMRSSLTRS